MTQMQLLALPEHLYMHVPSYGMTGTLKGATQAQLDTLIQLTHDEGFDFYDEFLWHFGDALGADEQAFNAISSEYPFTVGTIAHPGIGWLTDKRAYCHAQVIREPMDYIARNIRIAYLAHQGLFGLPETKMEMLRSGTWATIRQAGKLARPTWIIQPDGKHLYYPKGYKTVLVRNTPIADEHGAWEL